MSLEPYKFIGDHVPLNDTGVAPDENDIAMEYDGIAVKPLGTLLHHHDCIIIL
jgi:hypothetical protein